jgi:hypothetical protein
MSTVFTDVFVYISFFLIFVGPFFAIYSLSRRFELAEREKKRFSHLFRSSFALIIVYEVWFILWSQLGFWGVHEFFGNELLGIAALLMYLFLLRMRERLTGEDAYDRLLRFTAPFLMFYLIYCVIAMHLFYVGRILQGGSLSTLAAGWKNPLIYAISNFGFPFAFYFLFLSYIECDNMMGRLKMKHGALVLSAFLILTSFLLWLYNQFSLFLFRGTSIYGELSNFLPGMTYDDFQMVPGFAGAMIAIVGTRTLYREMRKGVSLSGKAKTADEELLLRFASEMGGVIGGVSLTLLRLSLERYSDSTGIRVELGEGGFSDFSPDVPAFVVRFYAECVGPLAFRKARDLGIKV